MSDSLGPPEGGPPPEWLRLLDADPATAERQYERLRRDVMRYASWRGDAAEIADEAIPRGLSRLFGLGATMTYEEVRAYMCGVARLVALEHLRKNRDVRNAEPVSERPAPEDLHVRLEQRLRIDAALKNLEPHERDLLLRYYAEDDHRALSRELGVTLTNLRVMIYRIRQKLDTGEEGTKRG